MPCFTFPACTAVSDTLNQLGANSCRNYRAEGVDSVYCRGVVLPEDLVVDCNTGRVMTPAERDAEAYKEAYPGRVEADSPPASVPIPMPDESTPTKEIPQLIPDCATLCGIALHVAEVREQGLLAEVEMKRISLEYSVPGQMVADNLTDLVKTVYASPDPHAYAQVAAKIWQRCEARVE